jgi:hypothetical protein
MEWEIQTRVFIGGGGQISIIFFILKEILKGRRYLRWSKIIAQLKISWKRPITSSRTTAKEKKKSFGQNQPKHV